MIMGNRWPATALVWAAVLAYPVLPVAVGTAPMSSRIAASDHTCALTTGGGVACWGDNSAGGLGNGTTTQSSIPVDVANLAGGIDAIAAGDRYSCAVTSGGGVRCWGYNEFGQLGDGTTTNRTTQVEVVGLANGVSAIAARGEHSCALISAGGVKCWGANINGQLGDGATASSNVPVEIPSLTSGVATIAVGGEHTCSLSSAGGVECWGWNATGQLGIGTTVDGSTPVDVVGLTGGVSAITAGGRHTCALMTAGGVRCWGYDRFGQLGDGTTKDSTTPVAVVGLAGNVSAISAGGNFTCALMADGDVMCWGLDITGHLGDGSGSVIAAPAAVTGLTSGVTAIAAGYYHVCGLTRDSGVTCWGGNDSGQLGNGTTADSASPTDVVNADGTRLIAGGSGDGQSGSPLPLAIAIGAAAAFILAVARYAIVRRRPRG